MYSNLGMFFCDIKNSFKLVRCNNYKFLKSIILPLFPIILFVWRFSRHAAVIIEVKHLASYFLTFVL